MRQSIIKYRYRGLELSVNKRKRKTPKVAHGNKSSRCERIVARKKTLRKRGPAALYVHCSSSPIPTWIARSKRKSSAWPSRSSAVDLHMCSGALPCRVWYVHEICAPEALMVKLGLGESRVVAFSCTWWCAGLRGLRGGHFIRWKAWVMEGGSRKIDKIASLEQRHADSQHDRRHDTHCHLARIVHFPMHSPRPETQKISAIVARRNYGSEALGLGTANDGRITEWRFYADDRRRVRTCMEATFIG
jgi:hypothetical protein